MKLIPWIVVCVFYSSSQEITENVPATTTTHYVSTIKSTTQSTTTPRPTTILDCEIDQKNITIEHCALNGSSIICKKHPSNYSTKFEIEGLKRNDSNDKLVIFGDVVEGYPYKISMCAKKYAICKMEVCRYKEIKRDIHISKGILSNINLLNDSIIIDCSEWKDRMMNATYHFNLISLNFNRSILITIDPTKSCEVTFNNLTSGTYYNASVFGVSVVGTNTSTIFRVLITTPEISHNICEGDLHSLKFRVDDVDDNEHFEKMYQGPNIGTEGSYIESNDGELKMDNLLADTSYNITVKLEMEEKNSEFGNTLKVESNILNFVCDTKLGIPYIETCTPGGFEIQIIGASSRNVKFPYTFSNKNGTVKDLVLVVNNSDGDYYKEYSLKNLIPNETCALVNFTLNNLPISAYEVYVKAYNRRNETSNYKTSAATFEISLNKDLIIALVVISALLATVILILVCLLCQCGTFDRRRKVRISKPSTSFSRFIASKALTMKKLSHRISHHPVVRVPISASDFPAYVDTLEKDSGLLYSEEFDDLKNVGRNQSAEDAILQCNRLKNRFVNILPYDNTRVKLQSIDDEEGSDYINANWIPGYHSKREFIATQGPLISTLNDFWRLVWEHNCPAIVMLTLLVEKNKLKCEQYWPTESTTAYGELQVTLVQESVSEKWVMKEFKMENPANGESKTVKHFHYLEWPDMNVPEIDSLLSFIFFIREMLMLQREAEDTVAPMVVHCSAGVGRSGTFIGLETLLNQLERGDDLDIFGVVTSMRMNRILMVQTEQQYVFLYRCLREVIEKSLVTNQLVSSSSCILQIHEPESADLDNGVNKLTSIENEMDTASKDALMGNGDGHFETMIIHNQGKSKSNSNSLAERLNLQSVEEKAVTEFINNSQSQESLS